VLEREADIAKDLRALVEAQLAATSQDRDERLAAHVLHDERNVPTTEATQLVLMHDVRMTDARHEPCFTLEPRERVGIRMNFDEMTLIATSCPAVRWRARNTAPMPPFPSSRLTM